MGGVEGEGECVGLEAIFRVGGESRHVGRERRVGLRKSFIRWPHSGLILPPSPTTQAELESLKDKRTQLQVRESLLCFQVQDAKSPPHPP